ncbi:hypothetical protein ACHAPU_010799 [Fusarium lateritium]
MSPERWSKTTLEKLSKLVTDAVAADKMSEAKNYLLDHITKRDPDGHLEPRDCEIASRWLSDQCAGRRSKRHSRVEQDPVPEEAERRANSRAPGSRAASIEPYMADTISSNAKRVNPLPNLRRPVRQPQQPQQAKRQTNFSAKKRKAEQALDNDWRLLSRLQAREERLRLTMASYDIATRQAEVCAATAALNNLTGQGDKHYTIRQHYQAASALIDNLPAYHLTAAVANEAAIATFEQSLTQATEALASAVKKRKENWAGYHALADELLGAESELTGLKKVLARGPLAIKVLEA